MIWYWFTCNIEHRGRTLHLLKSCSKPVPEQRKRRKVAILGSFEQYQIQQEEHKQSESASEHEMSRRQSMHKGIGDKGMGQMGANTGVPNIIGNVEDVQAAQADAAHSYPSLNKDEQMSAGGESSQFKDITGSLQRPRRNNSKTRKWRWSIFE